MIQQEVYCYMQSKELLFSEAKAFIETCYKELNLSDKIETRLKEIKIAIDEQHTYEHLFFELEHGAKMAWRNSNKCIGRLFWQALHVFDERELSSEDEIKEALIRHVQYATNHGKILPTITIFKPKTEAGQLRIYNHQLIRYAGYETAEGCIGDPASLAFTQYCQQLGWNGPKTSFDILPIVFQLDDHPPYLFNLPSEYILEVRLEHPEYAWFEELELRWYAVPMIADMGLEIGGIHYTAAPFNGWYMGTEIGARNLADPFRYNMLPRIAEYMKLNTSRSSTLWQDKVLVELNIAVLYSFKKAGVSIVDHHTAAEQFKHFEEIETKNNRPLTGDWTWLIPPISPATTHIFHKEYNNQLVKPYFYYQKTPKQ